MTNANYQSMPRLSARNGNKALSFSRSRDDGRPYPGNRLVRQENVVNQDRQIFQVADDHLQQVIAIIRASEAAELHTLFRTMEFIPVATHRSKAITLYRQGDVDYLVNEEPGSHAIRFAEAHGPYSASMAFRVVDAGHAYRRAITLGAKPAEGVLALDVPAVKGVGGSLLYFVDCHGAKGCSIWITGRIMSAVAGWMLDPDFTSGSSISRRFVTLTLKGIHWSVLQR